LKDVKIIELGRISYKEAWEFQENLHQEIVAQKLLFRDGKAEKPPLNYLIFCEHTHVYTLGKSGSTDHLLKDEHELKAEGIDFYKINRGGDVTYHGPGQIVGYPLFDLDQFFTDIHKYLRFLEETIIELLSHYEIQSEKLDKYTGVWIDTQDQEKVRKICAMGVRCSRWVTMHGFALNVNTDLSYFNGIIPCGISDKKVTSMQQEKGNLLDSNEVKGLLIDCLQRKFEFNMV
jgi:lipoyl(octanoyl) transferase